MKKTSEITGKEYIYDNNSKIYDDQRQKRLNEMWNIMLQWDYKTQKYFTQLSNEFCSYPLTAEDKKEIEEYRKKKQEEEIQIYKDKLSSDDQIDQEISTPPLS